MTFNPQQNRVFMIAMSLLALAALLIYNRRLDSAKADGAVTAKTECVANTNAALLQASQNSLATVQKQLTAANTTVAKLQEQKQATELRKQALKEEVQYVTQNWIAPGKTAPQPLPACVFTDGFVRVYNQSITANSIAAGVPAAAYSPGTQSQAGTAATVKASSDLQLSNLERADILQHITSYGARCQDIESQLNQLLDYLEQQGTN